MYHFAVFCAPCEILLIKTIKLEQIKIEEFFCSYNMKFFERALDKLDGLITILGSYTEIVLFVLMVFGAMYSFRLSKKCLGKVWKYFMRPRKNLSKR